MCSYRNMKQKQKTKKLKQFPLLSCLPALVTCYSGMCLLERYSSEGLQRRVYKNCGGVLLFSATQTTKTSKKSEQSSIEKHCNCPDIFIIFHPCIIFKCFASSKQRQWFISSCRSFHFRNEEFNALMLAPWFIKNIPLVPRRVEIQERQLKGRLIKN